MKNAFKSLVFSASICYHCSKWVLFIYTLNNVQLKSFVYECHTCITIIHCETVMAKMVFKANLHIHKSKYHAWKPSCLCFSFCWRWKKGSKDSQKKLQSKVWKKCSERVSNVDDNETAQRIYICFRKCLENRILYSQIVLLKHYFTAHSYSSNVHCTSE